MVVTLSVEVDGHLFTFSGDAVAKGSFLHGQRHRWSSEVMEAQIRGVVDTLIAKVAKNAMRFLSNAYPVAEHTDDQPQQHPRGTSTT